MRAKTDHDPYIPVFSDYPHAPEINEYEVLSAARDTKELSRRSFGRRAGLAAIAASPLILGGNVLMLDQKVSEVLQSDSIEIEFVNQESAAQNPHHAMLTFPGFNVLDGNKIGEAASQGCKEFMQVASVTYGNSEFNIPAIIHSVDNFIEKHHLEQLTLLGHSMGGLLTLEVAAHLHEKGIIVKNALLDCTPIGKDCLRDLDDKGMFFISFLNNLAIYGGMGVNYMVEVVINKLERDKQLLDCFKSARGKLSSANCSNRMAVQQICYMIKNDVEENLRNLSPSTEISYFCPDNAQLDDVIDTPRSYRNLVNLSRNLTRRNYLPGTAHASIAAHADVYAPHIRTILTPPSKDYTPGGLYYRPN